MDNTPNLRLPYIMAAQAQKHVTHNEAIRALDALVQLSVADRTLSSPPASPAEGARYIIAAGGSGVWLGNAGKIGAWQDGAWEFYEPLPGWIAWVANENIAVVWTGAAWVALSSSPAGEAATFSQLGVNATPDAINRLAVSSPATLLNHAGAGHQLKLNKAAANQNASLLYQDNWSGRAEIGLTGDDDFHVKVSADGSAWTEAIVVDRTTGKVTLPATPAFGAAREVLSANRTYYVRTDGSDSNDGRANSANGAFLTLQKAIDTVADNLDLKTFAVTIQLANGAYSGGNVLRRLVGRGTVTILGDAATPANVVVSAAGADAFYAARLGGSRWLLKGIKIATTTSGHGVNAEGAGFVDIDSVSFGACAGAHLRATENALITAVGNYAAAGGATAHMLASAKGMIKATGRTVTFSSTVAFSAATAKADMLGMLAISGMTFSNAAIVTGSRYSSTTNAVIDAGGGGASYLPGSIAGTTATGGHFL